MRSHMGMKQPPNDSAPKKNIVVYLNGTGLAGSACRLKYHACHGTTVDRQGVLFCSAIVATGLVVSGVDVVRIRSTLLELMSSWATWPARFGSDWLSFTTRSMA